MLLSNYVNAVFYSYRHFQYIFFLFFFCFSLSLCMIGLSNNIFKLHDLTMPCDKNKICVERCKVNYPEENLIFATCVSEDSSHSFCFCFSEEQRDLLKILLPKFFPELHELKMPCNKDIIYEKRCKEKYPKKKLTIATCVNKYSSHPFCFCLTENSQILLKRHYENELSLPCSGMHEDKHLP